MTFYIHTYIGGKFILIQSLLQETKSGCSIMASGYSE